MDIWGIQILLHSEIQAFFIKNKKEM